MRDRALAGLHLGVIVREIVDSIFRHGAARRHTLMGKNRAAIVAGTPKAALSRSTRDKAQTVPTTEMKGLVGN